MDYYEDGGSLAVDCWRMMHETERRLSVSDCSKKLVLASSFSSLRRTWSSRCFCGSGGSTKSVATLLTLAPFLLFWFGPSIWLEICRKGKGKDANLSRTCPKKWSRFWTCHVVSCITSADLFEVSNCSTLTLREYLSTRLLELKTWHHLSSRQTWRPFYVTPCELLSLMHSEWVDFQIRR